jgi:hypothetical protein
MSPAEAAMLSCPAVSHGGWREQEEGCVLAASLSVPFWVSLGYCVVCFETLLWVSKVFPVSVSANSENSWRA